MDRQLQRVGADCVHPGDEDVGPGTAPCRCRTSAPWRSTAAVSPRPSPRDCRRPGLACHRTSSLPPAMAGRGRAAQLQPAFLGPALRRGGSPTDHRPGRPAYFSSLLADLRRAPSGGDAGSSGTRSSPSPWRIYTVVSSAAHPRRAQAARQRAGPVKVLLLYFAAVRHRKRPHPTMGEWPVTWVGVAGFEPAASSSRTKRAAKLRYTPRRAERRRCRARLPTV